MARSRFFLAIFKFAPLFALRWPSWHLAWLVIKRDPTPFLKKQTFMANPWWSLTSAFKPIAYSILNPKQRKEPQEQARQIAVSQAIFVMFKVKKKWKKNSGIHKTRLNTSPDKQRIHVWNAIYLFQVTELHLRWLLINAVYKATIAHMFVNLCTVRSKQPIFL